MTTIQHKLYVVLAGLIASPPSFSSRGDPTGAGDSAKPYATICLSVVTEGSAERKEEAFCPESRPSQGESLLIHAGASRPCVLFIAAFNRASEALANAWRPQIGELTHAWEEIALPRPGWSWRTGSADFDLYAVFLQPDSTEVDDLRRLIGAMQGSDTDSELLRSQAEKLRQVITGLCEDNEPEKHHATVAPAEVSGTLRVPWSSLGESLPRGSPSATGTPGAYFLERPGRDPQTLRETIKRSE